MIQRECNATLVRSYRVEIGLKKEPFSHGGTLCREKNVPVVCIEAAKDVVTIDFNHLLAGKDLEYWFKLVDVVDDAGVSICASKA